MDWLVGAIISEKHAGLKLETARFFKMDSCLQTYCCENLKFYFAVGIVAGMYFVALSFIVFLVLLLKLSAIITV
jgi:hypothetical protein